MYMEEFDNTMLTNVGGVAMTIKHACWDTVERKIWGSIVCTKTVAVALGGFAPHTNTTSKHALVGLLWSTCSELGAHGIRVNCISLFGYATPLAYNAYNLDPDSMEAVTCAAANLKGTKLKSAHIAKAALFLASDEVDGGFTVVSHSYSTIQ
ncbi:PREDICTED: short-chain dehydrogenase reductase 3b-like [Nelumbo nucifera]|uniref:Short-chain dehydrogenase reductase 3b-like n=2 Tax=Nelumbo nucifera TaxID=4432 RepID=A0A822YHX7_NELNU|nr:PREDICTED: short-chain dehydrogenase reductase 3b-like [Nelumbo nucifera]DAD31071.1 TPA_asm: hypothetical protein HUJ06_009922 [Nelumbo nucifera]